LGDDEWATGEVGREMNATRHPEIMAG
jgi:hypothetical protein